MENLLFKRAKNIIFVLIALLLLSVYLVFFHNSNPGDTEIKHRIRANLSTIEDTLRKKVGHFMERSGRVFQDYQSDKLDHHYLRDKEALIEEYQGVIKKYYGEIYYFKFQDMPVNDWRFIRRKTSLFFLRKMEQHIFYVRYFCETSENFLLNKFKFSTAIKELHFFQDSQPEKNRKILYDQSKNAYYYSHLLKHSNNQLEVFLKFSSDDIVKYYYKKRRLYFYFILLFAFGSSILILHRRYPRVSLFLWFFFLFIWILFIGWIGEKNIFIKFLGFIHLKSVYEVLLILVALLTLLFYIKPRFKFKPFAIVLFNIFMIIFISMGNLVLKSVTFNYTEFNYRHIATITVLFILHIIPLFFLRKMFLNTSLVNLASFATFQILLLLCCYWLDFANIASIALMSLVAFILLFFKRKFLFRLSALFLIAVSIFYMVNHQSIHEKKQFITDNLKNVFLNQNNYAKFIAREIVHVLNLESDRFHEFFNDESSAHLQELWRKTIASRENIASGIFIISPQGELISHYSYQMPFLKVEPRVVFPFWAIEDAEANLYGRSISLAIASTNVVKKSEPLGRIIVQVVDSPELILRHNQKINIFTIDSKINGKDLSYIKLNDENQIIENPSNINLKEIEDILKYKNQWIRFSFIDLNFEGYIFQQSTNVYVIFFPANTLFKNLSEIIKIFFLLLLAFFIFNFKEIKNLDWKSIYNSFSLKVFSFLIVISLFTAIVFSIFSINFNSQFSSRQSRQMIYERGRTAQNIGHSLLQENEEFSRDHLQQISRILNSDVSVYQHRGILLFASNYRKIINNEVPDFLHSNILGLLDQKNQKFVLVQEGDRYHLYFKIYNYIINVELSYNWLKILSREGYYSNFIITLFFILMIIGFSSAFFFRNKILSPITELNFGMAEVEKGKLQKLRRIPSEIEIKNLYTGFNSMIEGIKEQRQNISEISRMKTIIKLGRRVAHEVKNPLTPIKLSAEQILKALRDKNPDYEQIIRQSVNYIIDETDHLKRVSYGFLDLSRLEELQPKSFDLARLIQEEVLNSRQIYSNIQFYLNDIPPQLLVYLDMIKIKQVVKNLLNNAVEAIGKKEGRIDIKLAKKKERLVFSITDSGVGMGKENLDKIFQIDYSTKEIGTGLGLFIVKRIIDLHKGNIEIRSEKNKGTCVQLELPLKIREAK